MNINMCDEFFYRVTDDLDFFSEFNTCKDNVLRNNNAIQIYQGEWVKVKINNYLTHIVKPTETVLTIAQMYGVNQEDLKKDNCLESDKLFIGQRLKIYNKKVINY